MIVIQYSIFIIIKCLNVMNQFIIGIDALFNRLYEIDWRLNALIGRDGLIEWREKAPNAKRKDQKIERFKEETSQSKKWNQSEREREPNCAHKSHHIRLQPGYYTEQRGSSTDAPSIPYREPTPQFSTTFTHSRQ